MYRMAPAVGSMVGFSGDRGPEEPCWLDEQCRPDLRCEMIDVLGGKCRPSEADTPSTPASSTAILGPTDWAKENPYVFAAAVGAGVLIVGLIYRATTGG